MATADPDPEAAFAELQPPSPDHHEDVGDESTCSVSGSPRRKGKKRDGATLRKAPQAPKRFKSSYICFFMAKQREIKEQLGEKATVTEISKRSAEMWRTLPQEERTYWDDVAAKDKQRYLVEKASYTGPWQVPWKRAKKDPSAPKRPMSAFLYFSQGKRKAIKDANPDIKNTEVSRLLGEMWRNASEEERRPHVDKEKEERDKYKVAIAEWRRDFEQKKEEQRKQQADQHERWSRQYAQEMEHGNQSSPQMHYTQPPYPPSSQGYHYPPPYPPYHHGAYPPPPNAYQYPVGGKQPVVLGPNGMPVYHHQMMPPPPQHHYQPHPHHMPPPHYDEGHGHAPPPQPQFGDPYPHQDQMAESQATD